MVRQSERKTRTVQAKNRKASGKKSFSGGESRPTWGRLGQLIRLYLELGVPWPRALQAAAADLQQLFAYYANRTGGPSLIASLGYEIE